MGVLPALNGKLIVHLHRMNYFELYGIPVSFEVDPGVLKKKYYELSRRYHPDFFTQASPEEQADVLEKSSQVNKAYKAFRDKDATMQYLLEMKGLVEPEEKYQLDPLFLSEVMDINEQLMEWEMEEDPELLERAETAANELLKSIYDEVEQDMAGYQEAVTSEKALLRVKDYYYRKKYLQRILDKIASSRNIATRK
jgi:molecular chaperone HscB